MSAAVVAEFPGNRRKAMAKRWHLERRVSGKEWEFAEGFRFRRFAMADAEMRSGFGHFDYRVVDSRAKDGA